MSANAMFWDRVAKRYAAQPVSDPAAYEVTLSRTASYLRADQTILELGCGTGSTAVTLAPNVAQMLATDFSAKMIEFGQERARAAGLSNLKFQVCDLETAPVGPFDVVLAFNLFHLLPELDASLQKVAQRLKPGGLFISKTVCMQDAKSGLKRRLIRAVLPMMRWVGKAPDTVHFMTVRDWQRRIEMAGFEILETGSYPADLPSRFVVARKS
ncbi:methyltransferase, UbiE/COQ5 family [Ruegeria sp. TrichCH4B]|nr:methyltransferase, UbiE/COQ5 family [Ruegeria sp. TrichCH4B]